MKLVKKGRPQKGQAKERVCTGKGYGGGGCGATLLVEAGDVKSERAGTLDDFETFKWFTCPECGTSTRIKDAWD